MDKFQLGGKGSRCMQEPSQTGGEPGRDGFDVDRFIGPRLEIYRVAYGQLHFSLKQGQV